MFTSECRAVTAGSQPWREQGTSEFWSIKGIYNSYSTLSQVLGVSVFRMPGPDLKWRIILYSRQGQRDRNCRYVLFIASRVATVFWSVERNILHCQLNRLIVGHFCKHTAELQAGKLYWTNFWLFSKQSPHQPGLDPAVWFVCSSDFTSSRSDLCKGQEIENLEQICIAVLTKYCTVLYCTVLH